MNTDLFLELTFAQVANSQHDRTNDQDTPELGKYDRLADQRGHQDR